MKTKQVEASFSKNLWYLAMPSHGLKKGEHLSKRILDNRILFGRDNDGKAFALSDFCPHRGIPLVHGTFDGRVIECQYHGWLFNTEGICEKIPALTDDSPIDCRKIKVFNYPIIEKSGIIWVYIPFSKIKSSSNGHAGMFPEIPMRDDQKFDLVKAVKLNCHIDHAVIGLIDPAHVPHVHTSWYWRNKKKQYHKEKHFIPTRLGFKMAKHEVSKNSNIYKLFKSVSSEITFQLPGMRIEHLRVNKKNVVLMTVLTPLTEDSTELFQFIYSDITVINVLKPLLKIVGKQFLMQDVDIIQQQSEGLVENPPLMLVGDADQQAKWYYKLKDLQQRSSETETPFENPLPETTLRWKS